MGAYSFTALMMFCYCLIEYGIIDNLEANLILLSSKVIFFCLYSYSLYFNSFSSKKFARVQLDVSLFIDFGWNMVNSSDQHQLCIGLFAPIDFFFSFRKYDSFLDYFP